MTRFQSGPNIQRPTYQSQLDDAFIGIQNSEDETGRTTQSYVNVQHPQVAVEQLGHNRWKQVQSAVNAPPAASDSRRLKRPELTRPVKVVDQENDLALNSFLDQNLENEESLSRTASTSSPLDIYKYQEKKPDDQESRRKIVNRLQPTRETDIIQQKPRKNVDYPRGTPAVPKTTSRPELSTETPFRITTLRNKYNIIRIKPTTYTPPSPAVPVEKHQRSRTPSEERSRFAPQNSVRFSTTTTERPELISIRDSAEFGRPITKKKTIEPIVPVSRSHWRTVPNPVVAQRDDTAHSLVSDRNHKYPEEPEEGEDEEIEYEYSSELSDDQAGAGDVYGELEDVVSSEEVKNIPKHNKVESVVSTQKNSSFDVLTMNQNHTLVSDENFRGFVDSALIDTSPLTEDSHAEGVLNATDKSTKPSQTKGEKPVIKESSTDRPITTDNDQVKAPPSAETSKALDEEEEHPTESWVIVASVQTSRSVSGARFLPGSVTQKESPKPLVSKTVSVSEPNSDDKENTTNTNQVSSQNTLSGNDSRIGLLDTSSEETHTKSSESLVPMISSSSAPSTESIIDKLDRVQSELSSGILSGGFRPDGNKLHLEVLPEMTSENATSTTSTSTSTASTTTTVTTTTTTATTTTAEPTTVSPPVVIRKFNPSGRRTTVKPRPSPKATTSKKPSLLDSIQFDELTGLLPPGFKPRGTFTPKKGITTTTESAAEMQGDEPVKPSNNSSRVGSGRSTDTSATPNKIKTADISSLLPTGFKRPSENTTTKPKGLESILSKVKFQDVSALLPPGFKPSNSEGSEETKSKEPKVPKIDFDFPSNLLPPGYKPKAEETNSTKPEKLDFLALLPPGYKLTTEEPKEATTSVLDVILKKVQFKDVSALLPPGFKANETESSAVAQGEDASTPGSTSKVVFPSRPGGGRKAPSRGSSSVKAAGGLGPVQPKIQKGWPTR